MDPEIDDDDDGEDEDCVLASSWILDARRAEHPDGADNEPRHLEDHVDGRRQEDQVIQGL